MKRLAVGTALAGIAVTLSGCGSAAMDGPAGHAVGGGTTTSAPYGTTVEVIAAVNRAGVTCKLDKAGPFRTMYSYRSQNCEYRAPDGVRDPVTVAIYSNQTQLDTIGRAVAVNNPGYSNVYGDLWSVSTPTLEMAQQLATALGGEVG